MVLSVTAEALSALSASLACFWVLVPSEFCTVSTCPVGHTALSGFCKNQLTANCEAVPWVGMQILYTFCHMEDWHVSLGMVDAFVQNQIWLWV